jgi:tetratricopeptide (TPR) repeat protein
LLPQKLQKKQKKQKKKHNSVIRITTWMNVLLIQKAHSCMLWAFFVLLLGVYQTCLGQDFVFSPLMEQAYLDVQKMKLQQGQVYLAQEKKDNGVKLYLENYAEMVHLLVTENAHVYDNFIDKAEQRLNLLNDMEDISPYQRFLQAEIRLHRAFVKLKFGHDISGSWDIIKAYRLLEKNQKIYPNFLPNYKSLGLLHVLIGSTPEGFKWVTNVLGLNGNIEQGIKEIGRVIRQDDIFATETQLVYFLVQSYILGMTDTDVQNLKRFVQNHPDNQMLYLFGASILVKNNRSDEALYFIQNRPLGNVYQFVASFEYLRAEILLQQGKYKLAADGYRQFLRVWQGHNFVKDSYYKLFLCDWLNQDTFLDNSPLIMVLQKGERITEQDKVAQQFAEDWQGGIRPHKAIMQARLAFDGGFYQQAALVLKQIKNVTQLSPNDQAAYFYRMGRVEQKLDNIAMAIASFNKTIALNEGKSWSFGASASLQLGYIYVAQKQKTLAEKYFKKALSYPKHEYKNSIDNKAKAALSRL